MTGIQKKLNSLASEVISDISAYEKCIEFCGPISTGGLGNSIENIDCLKSFVDYAISLKYDVFNQLEYEKRFNDVLGEANGYDYDLLDFFYKPVIESGYIKQMIFLPNWEDSYGCRWEMDMAKKNGISVVILEDYTLNTLIKLN